MSKKILITGSTDGIGFLTAKTLLDMGHQVLIHGRSAEKLQTAKAALGGDVQTYQADLSSLAETRELAAQVNADHSHLDVLINNAGILKSPNPILSNGQDIRFVVNTLAPLILTKALLPIMPDTGRILNLSSAAQAPINIDALNGQTRLSDMDAYSQSKLAITIWSQDMARTLPKGRVIIAVNPGSLLASQMVKEGFGIAGNDLSIGSGILCRLALDAEFGDASGRYWDNDAGMFANPHPAGLDQDHVASVMTAINAFV